MVSSLAGYSGGNYPSPDVAVTTNSLLNQPQVDGNNDPDPTEKSVMRTEAGNMKQNLVYDSFSGVDILVDLVLPNESSVPLGELQTFSYSMHRDNFAARTLGHVMPVGFAKSSRTIAGSMIFTVFNAYAFYRLEHFQHAISHGLYPVADMLPPFDINITLSNEYGAFSKMRVFGITFVDEGGTMSVDDMIVENTFSYMARGIQPLTGYSIVDLSKNDFGS